MVLRRMVQALVMIVDSHGQDPLGLKLTDHVVVQHLADFAGCGNAVAAFHQRGLVLLANDIHAKLDAFVADEHGRTGDQLANLVLALAAERAIERVFRVALRSGHHSLRAILVREAPDPIAVNIGNGLTKGRPTT